MIPIGASVKVGRFRLWIPLLLVWLLLLPIALLLTPVYFIACRIERINSLRMLAAGWQMLNALRGTHIEATAGGTSFVIAFN